MIYLKLIYTFLKIGVFSFGGGYAIIPIIQKAMQVNNWIAPRDFSDIVAISQITPGAVSINTAIYAGLKIAGLPGCILATMAIIMPAFILTIIIANFITEFKKNVIIQAILLGIRPVCIALIGYASIYLLKTTVLIFLENSIKIFGKINLGAILIFITMFIIVNVLNMEKIKKKIKIHPIFVIICSAFIGILIC